MGQKSESVGQLAVGRALGKSYRIRLGCSSLVVSLLAKDLVLPT